MLFFKFISQKIKDLYHFIKELFYNKKILIEQQDRNKLTENRLQSIRLKCRLAAIILKYQLNMF